MDANRSVSIQHCFERLEGNGAFSVSKLVEGAAYMLAEQPDPELEAYVDGRIEGILEGFARSIQSPAQSVRVSGHFLEAAVAWNAATGKRQMLDAARRAADQMDSYYGPGKATYISGHEGLKIGLIALYQATGDERYWHLAKFFADQRGRDDYERSGEYAIDRTYAQDHEPVIEQTEAVGHCVRATFLYIAMTDIAALCSAAGGSMGAAGAAYRNAVDAIWRDAVYYKTYLTGGIGSVRFHEQFGAPYELPNLSAWNETCAAYGNAVWNHRLFLLTGDGVYADLMERILYNALLVGVSLKGDRFFYQNPLKSFGDYERFEWINVPCCPPNVVRLIASIGEYVFASDEASLYVNLFVDSDAETELGGTPVRIGQRTRYPWDGRVTLRIDPPGDTSFTLKVRIPGWARGTVMPGGLYGYVDAAPATSPSLRLNGSDLLLELDNGYARIERRWRAGDVVELDLPMPVRQVAAHPEVRDDHDRVALQRGPLVHCAEWPDNDGRALDIVVPGGARMDSEYRADLLDGVQVIRGEVETLQPVEATPDRNPGARSVEAGVLTAPHQLIAIPYYAWANRGMGEMAVWLARTPEAAWLPPALPPGIAAVHTSGGVEKSWTGYNDQNDDLAAVHDGRAPLDSADQSHRFFRMRPPVGRPAWLQYDFERASEISAARVYWFDDKRFCKIPSSWRILYRQADEWIPVAAHAPYAVVVDAFNTMTFDPVVTTAVRLVVEPQTVPYEAGEIGPPAAMFIDEDVEWREFGVIEWQVE
ncbi:MAG: glycoside hydrolase family 127 protein [Acidobacteriota bacterium]